MREQVLQGVDTLLDTFIAAATICKRDQYVTWLILDRKVHLSTRAHRCISSTSQVKFFSDNFYFLGSVPAQSQLDLKA